MDTLLEKYKSLKKDLEEFQMQSNGNDEDFVKLVSMKGVDDDLKETLILLHSNYKAENKEQKSHLFRMLYKLVDNNIEVFERINQNMKSGTVVVSPAEGGSFNNNPNNPSTPSLFQLGKVHTIILVIVITVIAFFVLAVIDPDAFKLAMNAIKEIIHLGKS